MKPLLVLVHSPLVGAATWQAVAERLTARGERVVAPDLTPALQDGPPYLDAQVAAVRRSIVGERAILVGHSGAGPLLPACGARSDVAGYVFVDAGLPTPGRSWAQTVPIQLVNQVEAMALDGWLPPWALWWGEDGLDFLLPDQELRRRFTDDCPPLPLAMFGENRPEVADWPDAPCAYLRLGDSYLTEFAEARALGWVAAELPSHHLAMLTDPDGVADSILALVRQLD